MLSQILAVLYWYQPMFLWRFRILFKWPSNISHSAHKSLSRVTITFRAEHITFPQFYWQMCLFNLQLSVGFYSRTTVDISQSAPACCQTSVTQKWVVREGDVGQLTWWVNPSSPMWRHNLKMELGETLKYVINIKFDSCVRTITLKKIWTRTKAWRLL